MSIYPELEKLLHDPELKTEIQKVDEIDRTLRAEMECRERLQKKYRKAVAFLDSTCATLGTVCVITGGTGFGLLVTGVGFIPGLVLEIVTGVAGLLSMACTAVSRRCSTKARKHENIRVLASSKLNTVHDHVLKALEDRFIINDEYALISSELEKYRAMKEEIRYRSGAAGPLLDEATKKELIERGRKLALESLAKLAASPSALPSDVHAAKV